MKSAHRSTKLVSHLTPRPPAKVSACLCSHGSRIFELLHGHDASCFFLDTFPDGSISSLSYLAQIIIFLHIYRGKDAPFPCFPPLTDATVIGYLYPTHGPGYYIQDVYAWIQGVRVSTECQLFTQGNTYVHSDPDSG